MPYLRFQLSLAIALTLCLSGFLKAHEAIIQFQPFTVSDRSDAIMGQTISASQGVVGQNDIQYRPLLRTGEVLETIPGLIATQHSGTGKANQYFLRGFNLDHGTDFATYIDGMPVNKVTHGHGQGYSDVNFLIPELVGSIEYRKGPYYASLGDFSSAGGALISTVDTLDRGFVVLNVGENNFLRGVVADSFAMDQGELLVGIEAQSYDGPWDLEENLSKINSLVKYSQYYENSTYTITFMGYDSDWNSADQIPRRAVDSGLISALGSLDNDLGGESSRYSLSFDYANIRGDNATSANVYAIYYDLNLWSNFTYFLDNPINGDEFEQEDQRMIYGGSITHLLSYREFMEREMNQVIGAQFRYDAIDGVGLYNTMGRSRFNTVRADAIDQLSLSAFYENRIQWTDHLRSVFGLRADYYDFDVTSNIAANSGSADDALISPKLNFIYSPDDNTELFLSLGYGFHSNDARGTTISVDPTDPETPVDAVDPLVQSLGAEIGSRHTWNDHLNTSVSLWYLELDSELLFVGDAGITEASRPSQRYGFEIANYYSPIPGLSFELDAAFTEARFDDNDPAGEDIPGALNAVISAAVTGVMESGWVGSLRLRHFGPRSLIEDGSVESDGSTIVNSRVGFQGDRFAIFLDVLNLFDSDDDDITYFYGSRLPGEPEDGVEDIHFHPIEPRTLRAYLSYRF